MYDYLKGILVEKTPTYAVMDVQGVGYFLNISLQTYTNVNEGECKLLCHLVVREDAMILYGFYSKEERNLFRHLITVSGIGANTARLILSSLTPSEIHRAIVEGKAPVLQSVKGVGAKSAQRIILDLRDKLEKTEIVADKLITMHNTLKDEALSALLMLGFSKSIADKALQKILRQDDAPADVEALIKAALKAL